MTARLTPRADASIPRRSKTTRASRIVRALLGVVFLVLPAMDRADASERETTFSGEFQEVTPVSVSIRLADGRIIDARNVATGGDLSPQALAEHYAVGDQVQITCAPIGGIYDPQLRRTLVLQLEALNPLRRPSADERARALTSMAWRQPYNLLHPAAALPSAPIGSLLRTLELPDNHAEPPPGPAADRSARLELIRSRVLEFAEKMPNFVADEVAKRYVSMGNPPKWQLVDTVESEITFKGSEESREHITVSGKPWSHPYEMLPGTKWEGGFGSELPALFNPNCPATFELAGRAKEGAKDVSVVRYSSPPDGCVGIFTQGYERFFASQSGRIVLDEREENVIRAESSSDGFPRAFPISSSESRISWDYVRIGDEAHLLPVASDFIIVESSGAMNLIRQEYKNHRHFEASSSITFH